MSKKKDLGQFYTKNYEYILQNLEIPSHVKTIVEPFAGRGDLLKFIENKDDYIIEAYDIDPKKSFIIKRDTIKEPPDYKNKFVLTNPPYLARNKSSNKDVFEKYLVNDYYKCFIKELITNQCIGGIVILSVNFFSSIRKNDIELRKQFLEKYDILHLNIFQEKVFRDTTCSICSFQFELKKKEKHIFDITFYPSKKELRTELNEQNNYLIGGEIYNLEFKNKYKISRLTTKNILKQNTKIQAKCIDDGPESMICLSIEDEIYVDETEDQTARTYANIIIEPSIDLDKQNKVVEKFNNFLNDKRQKYDSLFLANYRESKNGFSRKRISFDLVYKIIQHILDDI